MIAESREGIGTRPSPVCGRVHDASRRCSGGNADRLCGASVSSSFPFFSAGIRTIARVRTPPSQFEIEARSRSRFSTLLDGPILTRSADRILRIVWSQFSRRRGFTDRIFSAASLSVNCPRISPWPPARAKLARCGLCISLSTPHSSLNGSLADLPKIAM